MENLQLNAFERLRFTEVLASLYLKLNFAGEVKTVNYRSKTLQQGNFNAGFFVW